MSRFLDLFRIVATVFTPMGLIGCAAGYGPHSNPLNKESIGKITRIVGPGQVQINDRVVAEGAVMMSGDHIETVGNAKTTLALTRGGEIHFDADTDPILEWIAASICKLRILINVGSILVDTPCETEAHTGSGAVIDTLKTTFHLTVRPNWTELTVLKGEMSIRSNVGGKQIVRAGYQCRVYRNRLPRIPSWLSQSTSSIGLADLFHGFAARGPSSPVSSLYRN